MQNYYKCLNCLCYIPRDNPSHIRDGKYVCAYVTTDSYSNKELNERGR